MLENREFFIEALQSFCPLTIQTVSSCCLSMSYCATERWWAVIIIINNKADNELDRWVAMDTVQATRQVRALLRSTKRVCGVARATESSSLTCHNFLFCKRSWISSTQQRSSQINHTRAPEALHVSLRPCDFSEHNSKAVQKLPKVCLWTSFVPVLQPVNQLS